MRKLVTTRIGSGLLAALLIAAGSLFVLGADFVHGPYTCAPSETSVVVSWLPDAVVPARIEYAFRSGDQPAEMLDQVVPVAPFEPQPLQETTHVVLDGLEPSTDYVYQVVLIDGESETASPMGAFTTAPDAGATVSFVVLADTQQQLEGVNRLELVGNAIAADPTGFDFILHGGDVVESPSGYYWDDWFDSFSGMLLRAPILPVPGNHERNHRSYYDTFELPPGGGKEDERWWALHWGDVVVVGLDSNVRKATDYTAQQDWARQHLSGPEPHKFVIFHHPVFSSDAYHGSGTFLDRIFHPVFVEQDVDIVFNGHSHHYERIVRDGVVYLVSGGGGATPRKTRPEHVQGSDVSIEGHFFYLTVRTSGEGIAVETTSVGRESGGGTCEVDGSTLDAFVLEDGAPTVVCPVLERDGASDVRAKRDLSSILVIASAVAGLAALALFLLTRE